MIREERDEEAAAIFAVAKAAFTDHPHSDGSEPHIVDRLRADGDLALSLVCEVAGDIRGHVAFSSATLSNGESGWYTLGPISIHPDMQRKGIGSALIEDGRTRLREMRAHGIIVLGDPEYYHRFGFRQDTSISLDGPLASYLQVLPFSARIPEAIVSFAPAFSDAP